MVDFWISKQCFQIILPISQWMPNPSPKSRSGTCYDPSPGWLKLQFHKKASSVSLPIIPKLWAGQLPRSVAPAGFAPGFQGRNSWTECSLQVIGGSLAESLHWERVFKCFMVSSLETTLTECSLLNYAIAILSLALIFRGLQTPACGLDLVH